MTNQKIISSYLLILVLIPVLWLACLSLTEGIQQIVLREGGVVEAASAAGYFLCAGYILLKGEVQYILKTWYFLVMILLLGLRELDFDSRFTTMAIFKTRTYLSPEVPGFEKLAGLLVIAFLIFIVFLIIKNHYKSFIHGLVRFELVAIGAFLTICLLAASKLLDGLPRKLKSVGFELGESGRRNSGALEEILELGIPAILFTAFVSYFSRNTQSQAVEPDQG